MLKFIIGSLGLLALIVISNAVLNFDDDDDTTPLGDGVYTTLFWSPDGSYLALNYATDIPSLWMLDIRENEFHPIDIETDANWIDAHDASWRNEHEFWFIRGIGLQPLYSLNIEDDSTHVLLNETREPGGSWDGFSINQAYDEFVVSRINGDDWILTFFRIEDDMIVQIDEEITDPPLTSPLWSPDGELLALISADSLVIRDRDYNSSILDVAVSGGSSRIAWSPNSDAILFVGRYNQPGLYIIDISGERPPRNVVQGNFSYVAWSPDGSQIAYTTLGVPGSNELHIVSASELGLQGYISNSDSTP